MKVVTEDYGVPIITVKRDGDYFVVDGHHRAFIFKKLLKKTAKAYVLKFPEDKKFRVVPKRSLETLPIKEVSDIDDPILKAWQRTLGVLKHYEAIYNVPFYLEQEQVYLKALVPTQPQVGRNQIDAIKELLVPIVCVKYKGKYYVLDGHARALRAKQLLSDSIKAIVLVPAVRIDFGIVKTAEETNLRSLEDIKILD
jgi:IMP dehydrogenase